MKARLLAFCHWTGWKRFGGCCVRGWQGCIRWQGWKRLFGLPPQLAAVLSGVSIAGLIWVFAKGMERSALAYVLYPLSAYCLAVLCAKLPAAIQRGKGWFSRHPRAAGLFRTSEKKFAEKLYREQLLNVVYGGYKLYWGLCFGSAWVGCDGIYNLTQSAIQLFQILRRKKAGTLERQWRSYRLCGVLVLLMHLSLTGIVFQMVNWNRAYAKGEILVITTAAFAFYKIIISFVQIAKDRKHIHPVDSSVRMLRLAQAIFAMFSLQASMLQTFGAGDSWEHWMNLATGCSACLLIVSIGIYMICRGTREIKRIKEQQYGQSPFL